MILAIILKKKLKIPKIYLSITLFANYISNISYIFYNACGKAKKTVPMNKFLKN
jgi:hypothetical protein